MGSPIQSWGNVSNEDTFWDVIRITATDPAAVAKGLNALMTSSDAKAFPGQIWLIQVVRGQASAAGKQLRTQGFDIRRLKGGMAEWHSQNLPLVTGRA